MTNKSNEPNESQLNTSKAIFRSVASANGITWLTQAFYLFKKNPLAWFSSLLIMLLLLLILMLIPLVNLSVIILTPVFTAGFMLGCYNLQQDKPFKIEHVFSGFKINFNSLLIIGLIYLGYTLICSFIAIEIANYLNHPIMQITPQMISSGSLDIQAFLKSLMLPTLILLGLMLPIFMATWFAPALVILENIKPLEALKQSFYACKANIKPFTTYGFASLLAILLVMIIAGLISLLIPVLGLFLNLTIELFFISLFFASMFTSYQDIFANSELNKADLSKDKDVINNQSDNDDGPTSIIV